MRQRCDRHLPSLADLADLTLGRDDGVGEKHLVEGCVAVHLLQLPHFHAALAHVEDEIRQSLVLRGIPVRAREQQAVVGVVGARGPDLLAIDDPVLAVEVGARSSTGEIGPAAGFAEQLAPGVFAGEDAAQVLLLLRIAAVFEQGRRGQ